MKRHLANLITSLRIVFSVVLLFLKPLSLAFVTLYITAGITDMIDETVARMTGTACESGAKLDTLADIVFIAVCIFRLIPVLNVPVWASCWAAVIALIKAVTIVKGYIRDKKITAVHSSLNKITGAALFAFPLTLSLIGLRYSTAAVCALATVAAIHEAVQNF